MSSSDRPSCGDSNPDGSRCTAPAEWRVWTDFGYPAFRCDGHCMPLGRFGCEHIDGPGARDAANEQGAGIMAYTIETDRDGIDFVVFGAPQRHRNVQVIDGERWIDIFDGEFVNVDETKRVCRSVRGDGIRFEAWRWNATGDLDPIVGTFDTFEAAHAALQ